MSEITEEAIIATADLSGFNPAQYIKMIQGKKYLEVKWRLVWFRQVTGPRAGTFSLEIEHDREKKCARYWAIAWDGSDDHWREIKYHGARIWVCGRVGTGTKTEDVGGFPDYVEKAETGAMGRALAALGFGTQFTEDFDEKGRIVDSPVERRARTTPAASSRPQQPAAIQGDATSKEHAARIEELWLKLGRKKEQVPHPPTTNSAQKLIAQLEGELEKKAS